MISTLKFSLATIFYFSIQLICYAQTSSKELNFEVSQINHIINDTLNEVTIVLTIDSVDLNKADKLFIQAGEFEKDDNILNSSISPATDISDHLTGDVAMTKDGCSIKLKNLKIEEFYLTLFITMPDGTSLSSQKLIKI